MVLEGDIDGRSRMNKEIFDVSQSNNFMSRRY